jgi:hypothetical protein
VIGATAEALLRKLRRSGDDLIDAGRRQVGDTAETIAKRADGDVSVYQSINPSTGQVDYVGITNNIDRRATEHLRSKGIRITEISGLNNLSRSDAKAVEQVLIELHGLDKNGGTLLNLINSIAPSNPVYAESLRRGKELLNQAGYPGI